MSKKPSVRVLLAAALAAGAGAQTAGVPEKRIALSIDAARTGAPISPYLYGQFIEHIGDLVNRSIWAEMRKSKAYAGRVVLDVMSEHFYSYDGQRFDLSQNKRCLSRSRSSMQRTGRQTGCAARLRHTRSICSGFRPSRQNGYPWQSMSGR